MGRDEGQSGRHDFVAGLDAGEPEAGVQRRGAVDDGDGAPGARHFLQHALETVDERADRGDEGALDALFQIGDLVAREHRLVQAEDAIGRARRAPDGVDHGLGIERARVGSGYSSAHRCLRHCRRPPCNG
ncbi:hypothetical protein ACVIHC_002766 [Bradyrhizobium diazoefficiens]